METKSGTQRQAWIDCARGIAIILVVLGHYDLGQNPLCKWISSFHLAVFFMLSGILVAMRGGYADQPLGKVLLHRTKQLLYPFFTFSLLVMLYYVLLGRGGDAARVLRYTLTLEGHNTLWFLPALWMAECMLLVLLRSRIPDWLGTAVILLGTMVYAALQYYAIGGAVPAEEGPLFLVLNGLCRAGIGFVMMMAGYQGCRQAQRWQGIGRGKAALAACTCFAVGFICGRLNGMVDMHYCVQSNPILYYAAALLQAGGLIVLCACAVRRCAPLEYLGRNSLIIMATHYPLPVINLAQGIMRRMGTGMRYADGLIGCALVLLMEIGIICLIRRCFPFMLRLPDRREG